MSTRNTSALRRPIALLALALTTATLHAQTPRQYVQQVVDAERTANQRDHSQWIYFDQFTTPKQKLLQWVASTPNGNVDRVLEENGRQLSQSEQQDRIQKFLHDSHAQSKQIAESKHDAQQVDDFLKLLPTGFIWTVTHVSAENTTLHFEPDPGFHPPTREARVFAGMAGELVADNQQHRVRSMTGHLIHDVTFGGGLLGRLKQGSSFSLDQEQVGPSLWQLTSVRVHLDGNALLFKSVSLQQDDARSHFSEEQPSVTLDQAAGMVMHQPQSVVAQTTATKSSPQ